MRVKLAAFSGDSKDCSDADGYFKSEWDTSQSGVSNNSQIILPWLALEMKKAHLLLR